MTNSGAIIFFVIFAIIYVASVWLFRTGHKVSRLKLLGSMVLIYVAVIVVSLLMQQYLTTVHAPDPAVFFGISFLAIAAAGAATGYFVTKRMNDIGLSFYWGLLGLVPLVNAAFLLVLLALPSNFRGWQSKYLTEAGPSGKQQERLKEYEQEFVLKQFLEVDPKNAEMAAKGIYEVFGHRNTKRLFRALNLRAVESKQYKAEAGGKEAILRSLLESISAQESDGTDVGKLITRSEILYRLIRTDQSLVDGVFDPDNGINWLIELAEDRIGLSANGSKFAMLGLLMEIYRAVPESQGQRFIETIRGASELLQAHPVDLDQVFARGINVEQACQLANLILDFVKRQNPDVGIAVEVQMRGQHPLFSSPELGTGAMTPVENAIVDTQAAI